MPWHFLEVNEQGYALPLVLVLILVLSLFGAEMGIRIAREARVTRIQENSQTAAYVAEAGLNRVRAAIINQTYKLDSSGPNICSFNGQQTFTLTYPDTGATAGTYTLNVDCTSAPPYTVIATGNVGTGPGAAQRIIKATIAVPGTTKKFGGKTYYVVSTTYYP